MSRASAGFVASASRVACHALAEHDGSPVAEVKTSWLDPIMVPESARIRPDLALGDQTRLTSRGPSLGGPHVLLLVHGTGSTRLAEAAGSRLHLRWHRLDSLSAHVTGQVHGLLSRRTSAHVARRR